jgi:hypothetical protein
MAFSRFSLPQKNEGKNWKRGGREKIKNTRKKARRAFKFIRGDAVYIWLYVESRTIV